MAYLDQTGLDALWAKIKNWTNSVHAHSMAKGASSQDGLQLMLKDGSQSPVTLSTVTITKSDITALGIPGSNTTYPVATQTTNGLMAAADKKKLDGVDDGANKYVHPNSAAGAKASGLYKIATDAQGHVTGATAVAKADISPLESDPTVPAWAKATTKPSYDSDEIASASANFDGDTLTEAIDKLSDGLTKANSSIAGKQDAIADLATIRAGAAKGATAVQTETDPTVPAWAKAASKPSYNAMEITLLKTPAGMPLSIKTVNEALDTLSSDKADKASPTFTGTPKAPTAAAGTNTTQIATTAFVHSEIAAASMGVAKFKGGMTPASYSKLTIYEAGWYWVVTEAGTIAGEACEIGDMVFCNTDNAAGAKKDAHFDIVQNNIDAIPLSVINALS